MRREEDGFSTSTLCQHLIVSPDFAAAPRSPKSFRQPVSTPVAPIVRFLRPLVSLHTQKCSCVCFLLSLNTQSRHSNDPRPQVPVHLRPGSCRFIPRSSDNKLSGNSCSSSPDPRPCSPLCLSSSTLLSLTLDAVLSSNQFYFVVHHHHHQSRPFRFPRRLYGCYSCI